VGSSRAGSGLNTVLVESFHILSHYLRSCGRIRGNGEAYTTAENKSGTASETVPDLMRFHYDPIGFLLPTLNTSIVFVLKYYMLVT
jgi:hypothetical protein